MKLPVITNSQLTTFRRCQREHYFAYLLGIRSREDAETLRFGSLMHKGLEAWWEAVRLGLDADMRLARALGAIAGDEASDEYEHAKAFVLMRGYDARWGSELSDEVTAVEAEFCAPIVNPDTDATSRTYALGGKIDVLFARSFMEHKTTSDDIGVGSVYWRKLLLDPQVSTYYAGAKSLGHEVDGCVYDVIRKPGLRPFKATPADVRKYTKDGRLYANQHDLDETAEEYAARLVEEVGANPDKYYQRGNVVRLEAEEREAQQDTWDLARMMRENVLVERYPRNTDACTRYGRVCPYFAVCTNTATLEDPALFERVDNVHRELASPQAAE